MINPKTLEIRAKKIGVLIRDARLSVGKSKEECADAIGVVNAGMEVFESGDKAPSLPELEALAYFLDVPVEHFWGQDSLLMSKKRRMESSNLKRLIKIRTRIIGVMLSQARINADLSVQELADKVGISSNQLLSYENATSPISLPVLEGLVRHLGLQIDYFCDRDGVVGKWVRQQKSIQQFLELSPDLQDFVTRPVNKPYLEIAQRLSDFPTEKLRALAEGLLDITF